MSQNVYKEFGSLVFNERVMRERLPEEVYQALHQTITKGTELDPTLADIVAEAMKDWAIEKGATHYTHWFQPMTGITAEKHDSFITPDNQERGIMTFSGKELIKGEPDASSFPSGGLRATFEARGYTAWDPTSYAFIKEGSLCIPTVFCSYSGAVLDKKTPLLRSVEVVSEQALRVLHALGHTDVSRVTPMVGSEQEYFLIDKDLAAKRKDLAITGRTLFGAKPAKGQELNDHYFGTIRPRVLSYMHDLNQELWKIGVCAKTEHNEVAPAQHELAPLFEGANSATDHNQLTMEMMKKVAERHELVCLLHEKPFNGMNGSGKHNNWSLLTDTGINLFKAGKHPENNHLFLLMVCAVIEAVDERQDLLRLSVCSAGNDLRLGGDEAPPAIVSIFLGDRLSMILEAIAQGERLDLARAGRMHTGVAAVPEFSRDTADRNRTSPMAFTGNKFEFRMLGSASSIAGINIVLNVAMADVLAKFADRLEKAASAEDELFALIHDTMRDHGRIVFNGNNYSHEWVEEAARRGLSNLGTSADALPRFIAPENIALFTNFGVFSEEEIHSRYEILLESYCNLTAIEAHTMIEMSRQQIMPAAFAYANLLSGGLMQRAKLGCDIANAADKKLLDTITADADAAYLHTQELEEKLQDLTGICDPLAKACFVRDELLPTMHKLRENADGLEANVSSSYWPYPTYEDLLFSV